MRHLYYYVPPCPECGSYKTGRYLRVTFMNHGKSAQESLRHGELAREVTTVPYENCYCEECGCEWHCRIFSKLISKEEYAEELQRRGIREKRKEEWESNGNHKDSRFSIRRRFF